MLAQISNISSSLNAEPIYLYFQENRLYELALILLDNPEFESRLASLDRNCEELLNYIVDLAINKEQFLLVTNLLFLIYSRILMLKLPNNIDYQEFTKLKSRWFLKQEKIENFIVKAIEKLASMKSIAGNEELAEAAPQITGLFTRIQSMTKEMKYKYINIINHFVFAITRILFLFKEEISDDHKFRPLWRLVTDLEDPIQIKRYKEGDVDVIYNMLRRKLKLPRQFGLGVFKSKKQI